MEMSWKNNRELFNKWHLSDRGTEYGRRRKKNIRITTNIQEIKNEKDTINFNAVCS